MRRILQSFQVVALLAASVGCGGVEEADGADEEVLQDDFVASTDALGGAGTYWFAKRDVRRCAAPVCGGVFLSPGGRPTAKCANGTTAASCYVASLDWTELNLPSDVASEIERGIGTGSTTGLLLRGRLVKRTIRNTASAVLVATEVWSAPAARAVPPTLYRISTKGLACNGFPCAQMNVQKFNSPSTKKVSEVDFSATAPTAANRDPAILAALSEEGLIVAGTFATLPPSQGTGTKFVVSQHYVRPSFGTPLSGGLCGASLKSSLEKATAGLLLTSESDYPFAFVEKPAAGSTALTTTKFRQLFAVPAATRVETRSMTDFFSWIARDEAGMDFYEQATSAKYRALQRSLSAAFLSNLKVWRVGEIEIKVYILGNTRCGDVAGLSSTVIET